MLAMLIWGILWLILAMIGVGGLVLIQTAATWEAEEEPKTHEDGEIIAMEYLGYFMFGKVEFLCSRVFSNFVDLFYTLNIFSILKFLLIFFVFLARKLYEYIRFFAVVTVSISVTSIFTAFSKRWQPFKTLSSQS